MGAFGYDQIVANCDGDPVRKKQNDADLQELEIRQFEKSKRFLQAQALFKDADDATMA